MLCLFISVLEENYSHSAAEIKDLMHFFPPTHILFLRKHSQGKDRLYCGDEIYNLDKIHKEMKMPLRKYCGLYDCFFAFVMGWQLCSKSWVVARIFVVLFVCKCQIALSGNQTHTIDFCCQELHKFFCFINFYLQKSILLLSLLCQDLVLPLLFWQDQPGSVLPRIMYLLDLPETWQRFFFREQLSMFVYNGQEMMVNLRCPLQTLCLQKSQWTCT